MNFRYGSQPLSVTDVAGFVVSGEVPPESVVTSMAGFAVRTQPGARTWMPVAFRYPLAVSRRTPVACSMRRKDQPSRPKAIICCRLSSLNTLLMSLEATLPLSVVNVPNDYFYMAGFEVTLHGRFWVTAEAKTHLLNSSLPFAAVL